MDIPDSQFLAFPSSQMIGQETRRPIWRPKWKISIFSTQTSVSETQALSKKNILTSVTFRTFLFPANYLSQRRLRMLNQRTMSNHQKATSSYCDEQMWAVLKLLMLSLHWLYCCRSICLLQKQRTWDTAHRTGPTAGTSRTAVRSFPKKALMLIDLSCSPFPFLSIC